jgi:transposase InsO family protein
VKQTPQTYKAPSFEADISEQQTAPVPDAALRNSDSEEESVVFTIPDLKTALQRDPFTRDLLIQLQRSRSDAKSSGYYVEDGLLYKVSGYGTDPLVIPQDLIQTVLEDCHDSPIGGGHTGFARTYAKIKARYFFPNMYSIVHDWTSSCKKCLRRKMNKMTPFAWPVRGFDETHHPTEPFEVLGIDILTLDNATESHSKYVMVVTDYHTRWAEAFALKDHKARTVARVLVNEIFSRYGVPRLIQSDGGAEFVSKLLSEVCKMLGVEQRFTSPYHPQCNGLTERANRTIISMLSLFCNAHKHDWDLYLPLIMSAHRASVNRQTGFTPYALVFGREPLLPFQAMLRNQQKLRNKWNTVSEYLESLTERIVTSSEAVATFWREESNIKEQEAVSPITYEVGNKVWLHRFVTVKNISPKLQGDYWHGPYIIMRKLPSGDTYHIQRGGSSRHRKTLPNTRVAHASRLRPYRILRKGGKRVRLADVDSDSDEGLVKATTQRTCSKTKQDSVVPSDASELKPGDTITVRSRCWDAAASAHEVENAVVLFVNTRRLEFIRPSEFLDPVAFADSLQQYLKIYKGRSLSQWRDFALATHVVQLPCKYVLGVVPNHSVSFIDFDR